jgi:hypothetical protein
VSTEFAERNRYFINEHRETATWIDYSPNNFVLHRNQEHNFMAILSQLMARTDTMKWFNNVCCKSPLTSRSFDLSAFSGLFVHTLQLVHSISLMNMWTALNGELGRVCDESIEAMSVSRGRGKEKHGTLHCVRPPHGMRLWRAPIKTFNQSFVKVDGKNEVNMRFNDVFLCLSRREIYLFVQLN